MASSPVEYQASTANQRLHHRYRRYLTRSTLAAISVHVLILYFFVAPVAERSFALNGEAIEVIPPERVAIPPPPEEPARPAPPVLAEEPVEEEVTIPPSDIERVDIKRPDPPRLPEDRIGGDEFVVYTVRPRCLERCDPGDVLRHLPMQLRAAGRVCDLRLGLRIDTDGRVTQTRILSSSDHPACDRAVEEWGATTRWTTAYNRDVPVEVWIALPVEVRTE
ncbi:MAG TPA: energy transducer TonB [Gemmatimonadota bacterium]|nr:energy transducer TonB [Gemmatimonadota bacterium]